MTNQVDEVEAVATAWALEFSLEVSINQGILQGDSKVVMKSLADEAQLLASFVLLLMAYLDWGRERGYIYIYTYIDILAFGPFFLLFCIAKHSCWIKNK